MGKKNAKKKSNGKKSDIEVGDKHEIELTRPISAAEAAEKKEAIYASVAERAKLKEKIRPDQMKISEASKRIEKLRKEIQSKEEVCFVQVQEEFDYKRRVVRTRRLDTDKLVPSLERTMEFDERQESLPLPGSKTSSRKGKEKADADLIAESEEGAAGHLEPDIVDDLEAEAAGN